MREHYFARIVCREIGTSRPRFCARRARLRFPWQDVGICKTGQPHLFQELTRPSQLPTAHPQLADSLAKRSACGRRCVPQERAHFDIGLRSSCMTAKSFWRDASPEPALGGVVRSNFIPAFCSTRSELLSSGAHRPCIRFSSMSPNPKSKRAITASVARPCPRYLGAM